MTELVARARGLQSRLISEALLADIERAGDERSAALALGRAGLAEDARRDTIERATRATIAADLAILARWSRHDALAVLALDEDVRSVRALVRGVVAHVPAERRRLATLPTSSLPERALARLAEATTMADLAGGLTALGHPLAAALAAAHGPATDLATIELALASTFAAFARRHAADHALRRYVAQTIDIANATSALLITARGGELTLDASFIPGGERLARDTFVALTADNVRAVLADVFAGTPLARDLGEEAALDWQLATQRALRRHDPHGLAAVIHVVLCRRREVRRLRRAVWRLALGGAR